MPSAGQYTYKNKELTHTFVFIAVFLGGGINDTFFVHAPTSFLFKNLHSLFLFNLAKKDLASVYIVAATKKIKNDGKPTLKSISAGKQTRK